MKPASAFLAIKRCRLSIDDLERACFPVLLTLAITWPQGELNGEGGFAVAAQVHGDVML